MDITKSKRCTSGREVGRRGKEVTGSLELPLEFRHQLEKLKGALVPEEQSNEGKAILFCSYNDGEGTSTVAENFARCLAQDQSLNAILIDANTRKPSNNAKYRSDDLSIGLGFYQMLSDQSVADKLPKPSQNSDFTFLPCGVVTHHPSQFFDGSLFQAFVNRAKQLYDLVIFDSSPIGKHYDAIALSSYLDGVILVVEAERTTAYELKRASKMLLEKNIPLLGVILNKRRFPIPRLVFERFF